MGAGAVMYAVLHLPDFATQAASHERPELRKKPLALLDGEPPEDVVFAANRSARALGVEMGMASLQAASFPGVICVPRALKCEVAAEDTLHTIACSFSPRIEHIDEQPGTYALDIRGMDTLFGDASRLASKLRQGIMAAGYLANVAVAQNFNAALCLARGKTGVSIVPSGFEASALGCLPLQVLDLEPEHEATFRAWGIRTCAELAALAETDLIARLGQSGKRLHALARGEYPHLMFPLEPSFEAGLVERMNLDFPVETLEPLLFLLSRMIDALLDRIKAKARAVASLRVVLHLDNGKQHERIVRPALPLQDTPTLLKLMQLDLEVHPPSAAILGLELHAQSISPYRAQHGLFLPQAPEPGRLEVLLARLRKLLGTQRVGSPELTDDHRPNAFRVVPFAPPLPAKTNQQSLSIATVLRICRPPQAINVLLTNGAPTQVLWGGSTYDVREMAGPWRVSGQWWSEANWCREEWDVRLSMDTTECICRVAFDPRSRCWYVQGTYD